MVNPSFTSAISTVKQGAGCGGGAGGGVKGAEVTSTRSSQIVVSDATAIGIRPIHNHKPPCNR
uniref:Uncharacterized protein n=1 Tax=Pristionchus pacificus TaxID=54126 RepID=A0A2A6C0H7_PRIPA|eukprot:PDM71606.1 hypothetical protein PRIPAC_38013 [Pristionchus pacificus]